MNHYEPPTPKRELLAAVQRRLPAARPLIREAFCADHGRPVLVPVSQLAANTFYFFDDATARTFCDAVLELAVQHSGGELTISYPYRGELAGQLRRLQLLAPKLTGIQVLAADAARKPSSLAGRVNCHTIAGSPLAKYRLALHDGQRRVLFICRDTKSAEAVDGARHLGFFSFDAEIIGEIGEDIEQVLHGAATQMAAFTRLETIHRTTQRVARELESYSRRFDLALQHVRRRPDILTPARLDKILNQAAAKMRELEEIPRRAMRAIEKARR